MKKAILILVVFPIIAFGCRKDQRKINRIEGVWKVRSAEITGFGSVSPDLVFKFDWCKARFDDFCDFSAHDFNLNQTDYGVYSISKDGDSMVLRWQSSGVQFHETFLIDRLNFRTLLLTNTNSNSGYFSQMRLRTID
jgi:hypothetical protein